MGSCVDPTKQTAVEMSSRLERGYAAKLRIVLGDGKSEYGRKLCEPESPSSRRFAGSMNVLRQ